MLVLVLVLFVFCSACVAQTVGLLSNGGDGGSGSPWLSVLNVLSGGVFVAAGFMHLLPDAEEALADLSAEWTFQVRTLYICTAVTAS